MCSRRWRKPSRRYASAEAFANDLQLHLEGEPVKARPASAGYRAQKFIRRSALGVALAALAVLALGLAGAAWQARIAGQERDTARREAATAEQVTDFLLEVFEASNP